MVLQRPPVLLNGSSLAHGAIAVVALYTHAWPVAVFQAALAALPLRPTQQHLGWGMALSFGAFGWYLLGLAPALSGLELEGPFGGSPVLFAAAALVSVYRLYALRSRGVASWVAQELDV